ncbi:MAG TPA: DUF3105 domain-containing protein [Symbiobacteriaceae bacterium]|nr:DUF3105 domain-containing protein [Symbiobacteriaceae bacterium]
MKKQKKTNRIRHSPSALPVTILVVGFVGLLGFFIYRIYADVKAQPSMAKADEAGCTHSAVSVQIPGMETVACKSANHVTEGRRVQYESDPPLAGEHWDSWISPGFYRADQPKEKLVHSLEHGHVVIYYDEERLSAREVDGLRKLTAQHTGQWDGVVAVPRKDPTNALILTAWEHALPLAQWDQARIDSFVDAFRGRGPENPVRPL